MTALPATLLLLALQAAPAAPAASQVIIWGGGDNRAEADASLRQYETAKPALTWLGLAPGFPKVVESKDYPGLKPGFTIVVLGFCRALPERVLRELKAVAPGAYTRSTTASVPEACPAISEEETVEALGTVKVKPWELSAISDKYPHDTGDNEGPKLPDYQDPIFLVLRDLKTGAVVQVETAAGDSRRVAGSGPGGYEYERCTAEVTTERASLTLVRECGTPLGVTEPGQHGKIVTGWRDSDRYVVRDGRLSKSRTHEVTSTEEPSPPGEGD